MALQKGARVRQVLPTVEGEIVERRFHEESSSMEYLVRFADAEGNESERWFAEAQIEEVKS